MADRLCVLRRLDRWAKCTPDMIEVGNGTPWDEVTDILAVHWCTNHLMLVQQNLTQTALTIKFWVFSAMLLFEMLPLQQNDLQKLLSAQFLFHYQKLSIKTFSIASTSQKKRW